jgi:hypothetical protein
LIPDPVATTTATAVAGGTIGPRPEIRNDAEGVKTSSEDDNDEDAGEEQGKIFLICHSLCNGWRPLSGPRKKQY